MTTLLGELVRRSELSDRRIDDLVIPEKSPDLVSPFLALTGLRGFWPMSAVASGGNAFDQSGNGRTLTYNGNPTYNYDGTVPYIDLDGTGDFLSRTDEAGLDILGTESYVAAAARGLTLGGWFWIDAVTSRTFMSKWNSGANQRAYLLYLPASAVSLVVSTNGIATKTITFSTNLSTGGWNFIVGRFVPSTTVDLYVNGIKESDAAAVPASIFNSNEDFNIGAIQSAAALLDGRASLCFLCAAALSDTIIDSIFQQTRPAYRV